MSQSLYHRIITPARGFVSKWHVWFAAAMLAAMFGMSLGAMLGDSPIIDEIAHIPASYSYLKYGDYRLNPEHPPLIKDLAGLPLQFLHLKFPDQNAPWTTDVNGQWETGWTFIYHIGNNPGEILFWSRLPILMLAIAFGVVLYRFCYQRWGKAVGLLTLFFYCLSPNLIAHAHYVTTDLGASVFLFLALVAFVRFAERTNRTNLFLLALALTSAQLAKFSSVLLFPFMGAASLVMVALYARKYERVAQLKALTGGFIVASLLSVLMVWIVYIPQTAGMPDVVQDRLITGSLTEPAAVGLAQFLTTANNVPLVKPLAQYVLGIAMVFGRVSGHNVTYFNGQISNDGYYWYFPELFVFKTQIAFLVLSVSCILAGMILFRRRRTAWSQTLLNSWRHHRMEWTLGAFAVYYFAMSVAGNLNLGIRHILPIYVPLFVIVAVSTVALARRMARSRWRIHSAVALTVLLGWYGLSTVLAYPSFTSYFNEFTGGGAGAGRYFSDSSVDWGQDLIRLRTYVAAHPEIKHIGVDYFGGAIPQYYFCDRTFDATGQVVADGSGYDCSQSVYSAWHATDGFYTGQYFAISETYLQNDLMSSNQVYAPLRSMTPVAEIGNSIYVYKLY